VRETKSELANDLAITLPSFALCIAKLEMECAMRDLDKALADILVIRSHIAAETTFHGYGPIAIAATGVLAFLTAVVQALWFDANAQPLLFLGGWVVTAVFSIIIIGVEMWGRSRRHHSSLADAMIFNAIQHFLPAGIAGALLTVLMILYVPEGLWMLPGLWQVLVSLGVFASVRSMPRSIFFVGAWYFVAGFATLLFASQTHTLSPWMMGIPFTVGQFLMAALLHIAFGANNVEN
jgi:hypothetical protein